MCVGTRPSDIPSLLDTTLDITNRLYPPFRPPPSPPPAEPLSRTRTARSCTQATIAPMDATLRVERQPLAALNS